jgi:hypothetical protein
LLTEKEVARSWGQIFKKGQVDADSFERAEQLLDDLRSESPLRHRLSLELAELRKIHSKQLGVLSQNA